MVVRLHGDLETCSGMAGWQVATFWGTTTLKDAAHKECRRCVGVLPTQRKPALTMLEEAILAIQLSVYRMQALQRLA